MTIKPEDYRRIYRQVRWSPNQRLKMERLLSEPILSPKEKPILQKWKEKFEMKTLENKKKRILKPALAALSICLAAGIGLGATLLLHKGADLRPGGMSGELSRTEQSLPEEEKLQSGLNADVPLFDVTVSDTPDPYAIHWDVSAFMSGSPYKAMQTEHGYYYRKTIRINRNDEEILTYYDKESQESVVVCAKPECKHNNEYCMANNLVYQGSPVLYHDDYLYGVACKYPDAAAAINKDTENTDIVLVRYAPDGTALEELVSFEGTLEQSLKGRGLIQTEIIVHSNALWINAQFGGISVYNERFDIHQTIHECYAIYRYDLQSGALTTVIYSETPQSMDGPYGLKADGDYIYFCKLSGSWPDDYPDAGIYRIDARTGVCENYIPKREGMYGYALSGEGKMVYSDWEVKQGMPAKQLLVGKDLKTGETWQFEEPDYFSFAANSEYVITVNIANNSAEDATFRNVLSIYNWEGKRIQRLELEALKRNDITLGMDEDYLYVNVNLNADVDPYEAQNETIVRLSIADLLDGKIQTEALFSLTPDAQ